MSRLDSFIKSGGGLVETSFGASPNAQDNILGLKTTSASVQTSSTLTIVTPNKITSPYASISYDPYWVRYSITPMTNESASILVRDSLNNPVMSVNNYYSGRGILIEQPYARLSSTGGGNSPGDELRLLDDQCNLRRGAQGESPSNSLGEQLRRDAVVELIRSAECRWLPWQAGASLGIQ